MIPADRHHDLYAALVEGLQAALGEKLFGVYVYGAAAFPEAAPTGDIDLHVILNEALNEDEKGRLEALHGALARGYPPLGGELDAYYLLLEQARRPAPPTHQLRPEMVDDSWALHREHIRAGRCLVLYGPDPKGVYPPATWPELDEALLGELRYVEENLARYPDYCILNLCRLMVSFETRDVVRSKAGAAGWALEALPEWRRQVELALKSYARQATAEEWGWLLAEVGGFYRYAGRRIEASQAAGGGGADRFGKSVYGKGHGGRVE